MTLQQQIDDFIAEIPVIPESRNYWLIRTQGGQFYESFLVNSFIAIEHDRISVAELIALARTYGEDRQGLKAALKQKVVALYPEENEAAITGQLLRFAFDIKEGDVVVIPSGNPRSIAIGIVSKSALMAVSVQDIIRTDCEYIYRKSVKWLKVLDRNNQDPYLFKAFFGQRALANLNQHAEVIERSLNNFFVRVSEANLVLEVEKENGISAKELFSLGLSYLNVLDSVVSHFNLDADSASIEVKINLNSPGKLHFLGANWKTIVVFGLVIIAINGGGLRWGNFDLSTDGIIKNITDYLNAEHDREVQDRLLNQYMDSLQVKQPDDLLRLLQQSATNKNLPGNTNTTENPSDTTAN